MKKFLICIAFIASGMPLCAQENFVEKDTVEINQHRYWVSHSKMYPMVILHNINRDYERLIPESGIVPLQLGDISTDKELEKQIVMDILGERTGDAKLTIFYVFDNRGELIDISSYSFTQASKVTQVEIASIDRLLRSKIKARLSGKIYHLNPVIKFNTRIIL